MSKSSDMISQIIEKLGMPIIAAVSEVERQKQAMGRVQGTPSDESQARVIAELLGKSTELGLMLFRSFDINEPTESRADAARLGMTALSSSVIANLYGMTGRIPGDQELQRLEKVVQSVVAFSENFESGHDAGQALNAADSLQAGNLPVLDYIAVHYSAALIPVVNAVAAFPFGRQEEQLMKEIVQRLMSVAQSFASHLHAGASAEQVKAVEVSVLKVAANTYAQCHFAEMTQLMSSGDQQKMMAQNISMDGVWTAFDKRLSMLDAVVGSLVDGNNASATQGAASGGVAPTTPSAPPPVQEMTHPSVQSPPAQPVAAAPADAVPPPTQPVQPPQAPVEQPPAPIEDEQVPAGDPSDPMSFFSGAPPLNEE